MSLCPDPSRKNKRMVADMKDRLMKNYHLMVEADYPPDGDTRGFPGNLGGYLTTGWCDPKF